MTDPTVIREHVEKAIACRRQLELLERSKRTSKYQRERICEMWAEALKAIVDALELQPAYLQFQMMDTRNYDVASSTVTRTLNGRGSKKTLHHLHAVVAFEIRVRAPEAVVCEPLREYPWPTSGPSPEEVPHA